MRTLDQAMYDAWKAKNTDPYSAAVFRFVELWANLLEEDIDTAPLLSPGDVVSTNARRRADEADADIGLTGFQYGMAVSVLAQCWVHGEPLRRWHNHETQLGCEGDEANDRGGVLNPALLGMTVKP